MTRTSAGFTTLELLLAMALSVLVVGAALAVASSDAFPVQAEVSDMHQRLRVAVDVLFRDLSAATAIRPYRASGTSPDPPGTFRADTITALTSTAAVVYWLRADDRAGVYQLMSNSGGDDVPVVDHVVGLSFDYFGDPRPPAMVAAADDPVGPWTTYGPRPVNVAVAPWAPRENCVFVDNGTNQPASRLPALAADGVHLIALPAARFSDGPWCPDAAAADRWDADLLRIRAIVVTVRVQAAGSAVRGPAGLLFVHGGSATVARRWAPDLEVRVRVAPRNMNHAT